MKFMKSYNVYRYDTYNYYLLFLKRFMAGYKEKAIDYDIRLETRKYLLVVLVFR